MLGLFQGALGPLPFNSMRQKVPRTLLTSNIRSLMGPLPGAPTWACLHCRQQGHSVTHRPSYADGRPALADTPKEAQLAGGGSWWGPYASLIRLHAPVGTWLLYWPCVFSITLATPVSASSATAGAAKAAAALPSVAAILAAAAYTASGAREAPEQQHEEEPQCHRTDVAAGSLKPQKHEHQRIQQQDHQQGLQQEEWLYGVWISAAKALGLCGIGAFLMRSAGCIVNDIWDRSLDKRVERTRGRPLASGALGLRGALGAVGGLLVPSLWVLLQFNAYTVSLGLSSLLLVAVYPAMKRIISLPQLFLGLTFNWGALLGWAALLGPQGMPAFLGGASLAPATSETTTAGGGPSLPSGGPPSAETADVSSAVAVTGPSTWGPLVPTEWAPVCLYLGCALWTLTYDTLYAFQDVKDDKKIGIKSAAVTWGPQGARYWGALSVLAQGALWTLAGSHLGAPGPYYLGVATCCAWLGKLLWSTDLQDRGACGKAFAASHRIGALFAASIVASKLLEYLKGHSPPCRASEKVTSP